MENSLVDGRRLELKGKCVLVLGGAGMVGKAVCRMLLAESPRKIVVHSLGEEAKDVAEYLAGLADGKVEIAWAAGDVFLRWEMRNKHRHALLRHSENRSLIIEDTFFPQETSSQEMTLWKVIADHKPKIVIDCINTATGIAYQNVYDTAEVAYKNLCQLDLRKNFDEQNEDLDVEVQLANYKAEVDRLRSGLDTLKDHTELLLCSSYIPQLVRHMQILHQALEKYEVEFYLKVGTTGTGGMGLNIPYTHGEEKPSRQLMSKTAVAGAQTLLLYLMHATPKPPITREIKPSAAIAWKDIGFDVIKKRGKPINLVDCLPSKAFTCAEGESLTRGLNDDDDRVFQKMDDLGETEQLQAVYIDTGENGLFSRGEFSALTTQNQMEFVTPEEIAANIIYEIRGSNTGCDVLGAIRSSTMGPSYRAGFVRELALRQIKDLEKQFKKHDETEFYEESIAFEMLGPPKLSKLLFEAYLLKRRYRSMQGIVSADVTKMSGHLLSLITELGTLRSKILSVGIPILLPDGKRFLRGRAISTPDFGTNPTLRISATSVDDWARQGWVDLRQKNMDVWQERVRNLQKEIDDIPELDQNARSSYASRTANFWSDDEIDIGELVGWIFIREEKGQRRGYPR